MKDNNQIQQCQRQQSVNNTTVTGKERINILLLEHLLQLLWGLLFLGG